MKTRIHPLFQVALLAALLFGCKVDSPEVNKAKENFVIAGDTIGYHLILINKVMLPGFEQQLRLPVSIYKDSDLVFFAQHSAYQGGTMNSYRAGLEVFDQLEILADTSMSSSDSKGIQVTTARILSNKDTIDNKGLWLKNTRMDLSYYLHSLILEDKGWETKIAIFNGWNNLGRQYLGYRLLNDKDTTYGWLSLQVEQYNKVTIYKAAQQD